jgi:heat-inducible transcriptional repressor
VQHLLQSTTSLLSSLSHLAGIVTLPKASQQILTHIEFLPLSDGKILVVLVLNEKEVQNRIIEPHHAYATSLLVKFGNYLTEHYAGLELQTIFERLNTDVEAHREAFQSEADFIHQQMQSIFDPAQDEEAEYHIIGKTNLLPIANEVGVDALQTLFETFKERQAMLSLFDSCLKADGVHIYVGGDCELKGCSMVTATYHIDSEPVGVMGVIGPNRMDYERVVPLVDITAKLISGALK